MSALQKRLACPRNWPPVARRRRLWTMRLRVQPTGWSGPYKSPFLPGENKPKMRRQIHLNREGWQK